MYEVTKCPKRGLHRWNISWITLALRLYWLRRSRWGFEGAIIGWWKGMHWCLGYNVVFMSCFFQCFFWFADPDKPVFSSMWHINWVEPQSWGRCSGCTKTSKSNPSCKEGWQKKISGQIVLQSGKYWKWCWIGLWIFLLWWRFRMWYFLYERHGRSFFASQKIAETCFGFRLTFLVVVCGRSHMLFKHNTVFRAFGIQGFDVGALQRPPVLQSYEPKEMGQRPT